MNNTEFNYLEHLLSSGDKPFGLGEWLACATFTASEELKQLCFEEVKNELPEIFKTREIFDKNCQAIANFQIEQDLKKIV